MIDTIYKNNVQNIYNFFIFKNDMEQQSTIIHLPTGEWKIFGNLEQGDLDITSADNQGRIKGTVFGDEMIGVFHASSGEIRFERKMNPSILKFQAYEGHISIISTNVDEPLYLLAGSYITIPFGLTPQYGWYATITKVI